MSIADPLAAGDRADRREPSDAPAVEAVGLRRNFGDTVALDGLDLFVPRGGVYGVLGPNGAGKTTAIRILATLLPADGGSARVLGHDVATEAGAVRRRVSLTGQFASVDEDLTGTENLVLLSRLWGNSWSRSRERAAELLDAFDLTDAGDRQVKNYSGGMRRRIDIAASIVVTPDLIFLDEPTTGLDPRSRNQVWEIVRLMVEGGTTVVLTTQYLEEADQLADRIAVIDRGTVIAEGTPGELKASVGSGALHVRLTDPTERERAVPLLSAGLGVEVETDRDPAVLTARVAEPDLVPAALAALNEASVAVTAYSLGQPSLDEVFMALTGHHAPEGDDVEEVDR